MMLEVELEIELKFTIAGCLFRCRMANVGWLIRRLLLAVQNDRVG